MLANLEFDAHTSFIYSGVDLFFKNDFESALVEFNQALAIEESPYARFDRALTLLSLGQYEEGFRDWGVSRQIFRSQLSEDGQSLQRNLRPWRGEHESVALLADAGFGDWIQLARFIPMIRERAGRVYLEVPAPLARLAKQFGSVEIDETIKYAAPMFDAVAVLGPTVETIPPPPYLRPDAALAALWANRIGNGGRRRIGITWSVKLTSEHEHPNAKREIALDELIKHLPDCELYSLQTQDREQANERGVHAFEFEDFADVAALVSLMDVVVSIDTAALHVAGALAHPHTFALLPYAATWRWLHGNWYPRVNLCKQTSPGDWSSTFSQLRF
jgi:hypothetical protein